MGAFDRLMTGVPSSVRVPAVAHRPGAPKEAPLGREEMVQKIVNSVIAKVEPAEEPKVYPTTMPWIVFPAYPPEAIALIKQKIDAGFPNRDLGVAFVIKSADGGLRTEVLDAQIIPGEQHQRHPVDGLAIKYDSAPVAAELKKRIAGGSKILGVIPLYLQYPIHTDVEYLRDFTGELHTDPELSGIPVYASAVLGTDDKGRILQTFMRLNPRVSPAEFQDTLKKCNVITTEFHSVVRRVRDMVRETPGAARKFERLDLTQDSFLEPMQRATLSFVEKKFGPLDPDQTKTDVLAMSEYLERQRRHIMRAIGSRKTRQNKADENALIVAGFNKHFLSLAGAFVSQLCMGRLMCNPNIVDQAMTIDQAIMSEVGKNPHLLRLFDSPHLAELYEVQTRQAPAIAAESGLTRRERLAFEGRQRRQAERVRAAGGAEAERQAALLASEEARTNALALELADEASKKTAVLHNC